MKREINLLSPIAKRERIRGLYKGRVNRMYWVLFSGVVILLVVYGVVWFGLTYFHDVFVSALPASGATVSEPEKKVVELNERFELLNTRIGGLAVWMDDVNRVLTVVPNAVSITDIELTEPVKAPGAESTGVLIISGTSTSREALVLFKQLLVDLEWTGNVDAPLKNYAGGVDAEFEFTLHRNTRK